MKQIAVIAVATFFMAAFGMVTSQAFAHDSITGDISMDEGPGLKNIRTVAVEKAKVGHAKSRIIHPGTVHAIKTANLAFRVSGPLIRVNVKPGDRVKKGQVLLKIDPQDFKDRINVLEAQLAGAKSQLTTATSDFGRMKTLFSQKVIPQADFDHSNNAVNTARAGLQGLNAQLAMARHQLAYTELKAPYDAIITARMIENHEMVSQGHPVVSLHDISRLKIKVDLPENEILNHRLEPGAKALVSFPCLGSQTFDICLSEWDTSANKASKAYELTFIMPAPAGKKVLPGMTAEVDWKDMNAAQAVITVPSKAVVTDDSGRSALWVFNKSQKTAQKRPVTLGPFSGASRIIIKSGITGNEWIVTQGMNFIVPGEKLMSRQ